MALEFLYRQPVRIRFGTGSIRTLGGEIRSLGAARCLVVCDRFLKPTVEAMRKEIPEIAAVFSDVEENPQLSGVIEAAKLVRESKADAVVGIGGGSTMDTAKFTAAIAKENADALACFKGEISFPETRFPMIAVPTTAGTGSEVTQVSVISHGKEKKTINNPVFMPTLAIVDPALTLTVPPRTTMNTGLDAMAHALEGYWSKHHQPISDLCAIKAVRLVLENLETAYRDGSNLAARESMSLAALLGGMSFALPKTAGSHACSYPLSEDYHLPHGEACAFTLDSFVRINADERLEMLAERVGLSGTDELADRIKALKTLGELRTRLSDLGEVDMNKLCRDAARHPLMQNNPVAMDETALRKMFEALR